MELKPEKIEYFKLTEDPVSTEIYQRRKYVSIIDCGVYHRWFCNVDGKWKRMGGYMRVRGEDEFHPSHGVLRISEEDADGLMFLSGI